MELVYLRMMGHSGAVKSILKAEIFGMEPERARRKRADQVGIASATTGLAESAMPEISPGAPLSDLDEILALLISIPPLASCNHIPRTMAWHQSRSCPTSTYSQF